MFKNFSKFALFLDFFPKNPQKNFSRRLRRRENPVFGAFGAENVALDTENPQICGFDAPRPPYFIPDIYIYIYIYIYQGDFRGGVQGGAKDHFWGSNWRSERPHFGAEGAKKGKMNFFQKS